ncbi:TolC family protein [Sphingomonas spermidinifaciens]|uniref:TolC family protein n=1 Tax=Sphingomonas spermidinifaciens TaxID=1141889 RepID=UPI001FE80D83|nr:TolC family protein [Sphingomonas spermidinifaciens]
MSGPLDLTSAVRQAVAWHPRVAEASGDLESRLATIAIARAGYLPRVNAGIESGYDSRIRNSWRPRPTASIDQMIFDFGKVAGAVAAARADTREGEARLLLAIDDLARQTAHAAIELQRAAALQKVADVQLKRVAEISRLVGDRADVGATTRSDAIQARARVESARATLSQIVASRGRWATALAYLTGRDAPVDQMIETAPAFLETACADAVVRPEPAPAVMAAEARRDEAAANLRRSRAEQYPTVSVGGDASTDITSLAADRSIYSFGLRASSEVFGGGARRARARSAELALGAAEVAIAAARLETDQALAEAVTQVPQLRELLVTLDRRLSDMTETGRLYEMQYLQMGTRTLVDLLNAEQELHQVAFDIVNTRHDLRRIETDCLYNSGRLRSAFGIDPAAARGGRG